MSNDDDSNALVALGVGPAAKELYVDLLRPSARLLGKDLELVARLVSHAMTPLEATVWGLDRVRDWLRVALLKRLATTDPDEIRPPPAYIAGQVLLQLPFCADQDELREMYANLLASAMKASTATKVHPSFVHVIQQITPAEALLLAHIARREGIFSIQEAEVIGGKQAGPSLSDQFRGLCLEAGMTSPENGDSYLDNLIRLRIFSILDGTESKYLTGGSCDEGIYEASVENEHYRIVELSAYGENFLGTCVDETDPAPSTPESTP